MVRKAKDEYGSDSLGGLEGTGIKVIKTIDKYTVGRLKVTKSFYEPKTDTQVTYERGTPLSNINEDFRKKITAKDIE